MASPDPSVYQMEIDISCLAPRFDVDNDLFGDREIG